MTTLVLAQDLRLSYGDRVILEGVSLRLGEGERVALLGRNGAGKTSLLRVLTRELRPDDGEVWWQGGLRWGVLAQQQSPPPGRRVRDLVDEAHPYRAAEARLLELEADLGDPERLAAWSELRAGLEAAQAFAWPSRVRRILGQLDLTRFLAREAASLSGGERTRLALALALAREPDVLALDEPTNHLDIRMREWLEGELRAFRGGVLLTSHDRDFLDAVATRSVWLAGGEASEYPGGYSRAAAQRSLERRTRARAAQLGGRETERLQGSAEWLGRRGQRSAALRSRAERVPVTEAPLPERQLRMRLLSGSARARMVAWGEHLSKSYGDRTVLRGAAFKLRQGDRVALMGANGSGKTTLLRLLSGELFPDDASPPPSLQVAPGVTVATLDQTWHGLTPGRGLRAQFEARFGTQSAALLGRAGFGAGDWAKTPEELSGGERARAGLALVSALRADLLLLDEPTNHLDVEALQALEGAVHAYSGAVVIVTHDRRFAREVANRLWVIEAGGELREVAGWGNREYRDPARSLTGDPPPPPPPPSARQRLPLLERRLAQTRAALDAPPGQLTGREEARLRAQAHQTGQELYALYAEAFAAPEYDCEFRSGPLRVRAQRLGERGGMFWAARDETCPHLAWDGQTLRFSAPPPGWYGAALLGAALPLLFLRWGATRVTLGEGGRVLTRREWFELEGWIA